MYNSFIEDAWTYSFYITNILRYHYININNLNICHEYKFYLVYFIWVIGAYKYFKFATCAVERISIINSKHIVNSVIVLFIFRKLKLIVIFTKKLNRGGGYKLYKICYNLHEPYECYYYSRHVKWLNVFKENYFYYVLRILKNISLSSWKISNCYLFM